MYQSSDNEASIHQPQRGYFIRIVTLLLVLFALLAVGVSIAMAQDASGNTIFLPLVTNNGASVAVEDESSENAVVNAFPQDVEPPPADDEVQAAVVNALDMAEVQLFGASADTAATIVNGVYLVKALHSDKCMEVAGAGTANGSNVQQRSCNPTARHHQWQFTAVGNGYYKITNLNSGKVLDVA
jgi:Tfp pilus assembly protein PilX